MAFARAAAAGRELLESKCPHTVGSRKALGYLTGSGFSVGSPVGLAATPHMAPSSSAKTTEGIEFVVSSQNPSRPVRRLPMDVQRVDPALNDWPSPPSAPVKASIAYTVPSP